MLSDGRACRNLVGNPNDAVISFSNKLVKEVSGENSQLIFYASNLNAPIEFDRTVAYLQGESLNNYFHWMFQVIPQICLLRHAGINLDTIEKFAFFRLPICLPFQKETLNFLNIPRSKIVETIKYPYIKAKKLIVTSSLKIAPPRKLACDLLRHEFLNNQSNLSNNKLLEFTNKTSRIYISRKKASYRKIINEDRLINLLNRFGFKTFHLESISFLEQVNLFSKAEIVVSPHGAGLTNLVFCSPGTKVIEIFAEGYVPPGYKMISSYYNLDYYYLISEGVENAQAKRKARDRHINVNLNSLLDLMKLAEIF